MRIVFEEDGSFLELIPTEDNKIAFIMCGRKSHKEVTMSSADLSLEQVSNLATFLMDWLDDNEEHFT